MSKSIEQKIEAAMKSVAARQVATGEFECVAGFGGNNGRSRMRGVGETPEQARASLEKKLRKMYAHATQAPHYKRTGRESERRWQAPGGIEVVASRDENSHWRVDRGPKNLLGRTFAHMRDLRSAVKQSGN